MDKMTDLIFDQGFAYIPIPPHQKKPIVKGWNLKQNCITDGADANKLDGKNVGIAHAYCEPITCCWDIDNYRVTKELFDLRGVELKNVLQKSNAAVMHSGRRNSLKAVFTLPESVGALVTKVVRRNDGVAYEFRCASTTGNTVCDVIPPSIHPSGTQYRWVQGDLTSIPEIPERLLAHWQNIIDDEAVAKKNATHSHIIQNWEHETPRKIALLRKQLTYISPDCDYPLWRDIIWAILNTGFPSAYAIARDWSEGAPHRYQYAHFHNTTESWSANRARHTWGTIYHYARMGGWHG